MDDNQFIVGTVRVKANWYKCLYQQADVPWLYSNTKLCLVFKASKIHYFSQHPRSWIILLINKSLLVQGFENKRCFLPHVNLKISEECPDNFTFNPDNEYIKIRHKELWKGSYEIEGAREEGFIVESGGHQSSSGHFHVEGQQSSSEHQSSSGHFNQQGEVSGTQRETFSGSQEAVQLYPQEISLKLRISESILFYQSFSLMFWGCVSVLEDVLLILSKVNCKFILFGEIYDL